MFLKTTVWLSPQSICRGGGRGWEEGESRVIVLTVIVLNNKEAASLVGRRSLYRAGCQWARANEGEEAYRRRRWGVKPSRAVLLSSALTSSGNRDKSSRIFTMSLTPSPTQSRVHNNTTAPETLPVSSCLVVHCYLFWGGGGTVVPLRAFLI